MSSTAENLSKLRGLTGRDRRVFFLALVALPLISIGLRMSGLRRVQAGLARRTKAVVFQGDGRAGSVRAAEVARLAAAAARHGLFPARCLPVSLTLGWLLQREGIDTTLRLGVRKSTGRLEAHAWVEYRGLPLIDTQEVHERFAAFDAAVAPRPSTLR